MGQQGFHYGAAASMGSSEDMQRCWLKLIHWIALQLELRVGSISEL